MDGKIVIVKKKKYNTVISSSSEDENDSDYVASKRSNNISSGSDSSDLSSNEYYEIEKLLDKRINPITGVTEYLVKWEGYSSDENTWEPEPNLVEDDNEDLITEWRQSQAMKSPELRAAKNTLLSKLRARHLTPTLGRVLSGDDFVLPETNGWEDVLNGKDDFRWYAMRKYTSSYQQSETHPHFKCHDCGQTKCLDQELFIPLLPNHKILTAELLLTGQCEDCLS